MNPLCRVQFMTHEKKAERAIILVHGYTNCPLQFIELGRRFFDLGYNVLIPPIPHHGLCDLMTKAHGALTAEELEAYADESVDIARGLGDHVIMMGISLGGLVTAWTAQARPEIDLAVAIAPSFSAKAIPAPLTATLMNVFSLLPDSFEWWNPALKDKMPPPHGYPVYSRHAMANVFRLAFAIRADIQRRPPKAKRIVMVFNPNDDAVDNVLNMEVAKAWQEKGANLTTYEFEADLMLVHDLVDPTQPLQKIDIVYPRLIDLVDRDLGKN
jgi:esterase/lipase